MFTRCIIHEDVDLQDLPDVTLKVLNHRLRNGHANESRGVGRGSIEQRCVGTGERDTFRKRSLRHSGLVDAVIFGNELNLLTTSPD
jgi:hypothetical protein